MATRLQIRRQNHILSAITDALPATVVVVDTQGRYRCVNSAFERYTGRGAAQIIGRTADEILGVEEVTRRTPDMIKAIAGEPVDFIRDYPSAQGITCCSMICIPLSPGGMLDGFVGICQDVAIQRREQERLAQLAERDPLTGPLNRAGLELDGRSVSVSASVGVAVRSAQDVGLRELLARADGMLYRAKRAGRGRHALGSGGALRCRSMSSTRRHG